MEIKFANAPISWGVNEFGIEAGVRPEQMLDELKLAGYTGTELGDYGFFPKDPAELKKFLNERDTSLIGAFCCYALSDPSTFEKGRTYARQVAAQLAQFQDQVDPPHIVLSDDVSDPIRISNTGKITQAMGLAHSSPAKWKVLCAEVDYLKKMIKEEFGVSVYYHPHCGSFIETPWEIEQLVRDTSVNLIFDTAHITMGAHARPMYLMDLLRKFPERIHSFHFKDYTPDVHGSDYFELVKNGCFPELGNGIVDFGAVKRWQQMNNWKGWVVVEQDVLTGDDAASASESATPEPIAAAAAVDTPLQSAVRNMSFLKTLYQANNVAGVVAPVMSKL